MILSQRSPSPFRQEGQEGSPKETKREWTPLFSSVLWKALLSNYVDQSSIFGFPSKLLITDDCTRKCHPRAIPIKSDPPPSILLSTAFSFSYSWLLFWTMLSRILSPPHKIHLPSLLNARGSLIARWYTPSNNRAWKLELLHYFNQVPETIHREKRPLLLSLSLSLLPCLCLSKHSPSAVFLRPTLLIWENMQMTPLKISWPLARLLPSPPQWSGSRAASCLADTTYIQGLTREIKRIKKKQRMTIYHQSWRHHTSYGEDTALLSCPSSFTAFLQSIPVHPVQFFNEVLALPLERDSDGEDDGGSHRWTATVTGNNHHIRQYPINIHEVPSKTRERGKKKLHHYGWTFYYPFRKP